MSFWASPRQWHNGPLLKHSLTYCPVLTVLGRSSGETSRYIAFGVDFRTPGETPFHTVMGSVTVAAHGVESAQRQVIWRRVGFGKVRRPPR